MNGEVLSGAMTRGYLSVSRLVHPWERADMTGKTYDYLFPPLKRGKVSLRHGVVIGLPECGKTEMINDIAHHFRDFYGRENVNIVFCECLQDALANIDAKPAQLLLVDDAVKQANSRKSGANADDIADYYEIRHQFERRARTLTGVIILIYVSQRFKSLDIVFRNAMYIWFKTATVDPDDKDIIRKYGGSDAFEDIEKVSARMYYHHDDSAKERCIIHLPLEHTTGYFRSEMRERIITMVGRQEIRQQEVFFFDRSKFIEELLKDDRWAKAARCYMLSKNGIGQEQIAQDPQVQVNRSRVSQLIGKVRGEISNRSGAAYETFKAQQLERDGWTVQHDGKRGRPDIVAMTEQGQYLIYSCKCLEFNRTYIIDRKELEPEILEAARKKCGVVLSVWNLHEMREQEIRWENPLLVPEKISIEPLTR